jgi:hypothetical protein
MADPIVFAETPIAATSPGEFAARHTNQHSIRGWDIHIAAGPRGVLVQLRKSPDPSDPMASLDDDGRFFFAYWDTITKDSRKADLDSQIVRDLKAQVRELTAEAI